MHNDQKLIEDRLARTVRERLRPLIYRPLSALDLAVWHVDGGKVDAEHGEPVPAETALAQEYAPTELGTAWGPAWGSSWFRLRADIPEVPQGTVLEVVFNPGFDDIDPGFHAEGLVYRPDGTVIKGLNPKNQWIPVDENTAPDGKFEVFVEAAANPRIASPEGYTPTFIGDKLTASREPLYRLRRADLNVFETELWELVQDLETLGELSRELSTTSARKYRILRALEKSLDRIDLQNPAASASAARAELHEVLASPAEASAHRITAVGHAHIDSAWLWPLRETVRKVARTTANVLNLMDRDPSFVFVMSQAQQLAWLKDNQPGLFERVKKYVKEGRFIPVGGMWVEADGNMPGGEALARQFVYGKRFFLEEFGVETEEVWLPDSFGYSAAYPQVAKAAGARWFLTQKISWNTVNHFPHHSFDWEGIDGTRIFTHFPPVDTYSSDLSGGQLAHAAGNFRDKSDATRSLAPFGWGDGGGGPTREMLARTVRNADLEGSPRVVMESPRAFFAAAEAEYQPRPVWSGELYLELHRGTFTTQAKNKAGNRRSEHLLFEAELWCATATVRFGAPYPYVELERIWKEVLLLQFHDILPGTSIAWVHREAAESYQRIEAELEQIIASAQRILANATPESDAVTGGGRKPGTVLFNAAAHARDGAPALGAAVVPTQSGLGEATCARDGDGWVISNGVLTVRIDTQGLFQSVYDEENKRETLAAAGNLFQLHPDYPNDWDAWDIDAFYRNTHSDLTDVESIEPLAPKTEEHDGAGVIIRRRFGDSAIVQHVSLQPGSRRVDLHVEVDWHEREKLLKLAFPLDVQARHSSAEIQFGYVQRPTHVNTSWDAAKFEICAHRWLHIGEPGYGVAIANSATYGHDVRSSGTTTTVRLSVLRAPRFPDPLTDQGRHVFDYALIPGVDVIDATREGVALNLPQRTVAGTQDVSPLVTVDAANVIVSAVKLAEDRSGDVILRLYESSGGRAVTTITPGFSYRNVEVVDLLERSIQDGPVLGLGTETEPGISVELRPFQILSLRLSRD